MCTKEIRNLLLDCRSALRKADADFERSPLGERLDQTIIGLGEADRRQEVAAREQAQSAVAQRVAYAWQSVTRELRHTQPDLYRQLSEKVLQRLDSGVPDGPAEEIEKLRTDLAQREEALANATAELAALRTALASAVPLSNVPASNETELAQQRLQALLQAALQGGGLPQETPAAETAESDSPTRASLQAVVEGRRTLSRNEREWCVGEAMVLTGFQKTPNQLLAQGDGELVRLVLAGMALYA